MRINLSHILTVSILISAPPLFAQGPLAPAGAPAPTMKTLDQVEARTPITNIPYTIISPGSYYLAGSLSMTSGSYGVHIQAHNVTLDLNGFTLTGATNTWSGVYVNSTIYSNIVVCNGSIINWRDYGVDGNASDNLNVRNVMVSKVGKEGIRLGLNGMAENCQVMSSRGGIFGYQASMVRKSQIMNMTGNGIYLGAQSMVEDTQAIGCGTNGIYVGNDSVVKNCLVVSNRASGISIGDRSAALDNQCSYNAFDGTSAHITSRGNESRVERNQLGQTVGDVISARGRDNVIADNVSLDTLPSYDLGGTNAISILIHKLPVFLSWPCSAKLAGSLNGPDGIFIESDGVTLDLDGHMLTGTGASMGINLNDYDHLTVRNGTLRNWTYGAGGSDSDNCTFENVKFVSNGFGLRLGAGAQVTRCGFYDNSDTALDCGHAAMITECEAVNNNGTGFDIGMGGLISRSVARNNGEDGFRTGAGSSISGCAAMNNATNGILASTCFVSDNTCTLNRNGILISGEGSRVDNNLVSFNNTYGIRVTGFGNIVMRNTARANGGGNYEIAAGNATGILVNVTAGGAISSSNPWVNFSY